MIACIDSSVILRMILGQPDRLSEWKTLRFGIAARACGLRVAGV